MNFEKWLQLYFIAFQGERSRSASISMEPTWDWQGALEERGVIEDSNDWYFRHEELYERCLNNGMQWTSYWDDDYPTRLKRLEKPPLLLSYLGSVCWNSPDRALVSIVGSRNPSQESLKWMELELSQFIESEDVVIVSGGARGVDKMAHQLAIRKQKSTVAWMPSGLFQIYPRQLNQIKNEIVQSGGAIVSQFAPDQPMFKWQFHIRNECIATGSDLLLVVEARRRSGTLVTAAFARDRGTPLFVVPSSPANSTGLGGLDLIADGAALVRDSQDLSVALRYPAQDAVNSFGVASPPRSIE